MVDDLDGPTANVLDQLYRVVKGRQENPADGSYTASLFAKGRLKIAQKVGEEAVETALAAVALGPEAVVLESADLLYHLLVLWADSGVDPAAVWMELERRVGTSGLTEKRNRLTSVPSSVVDFPR